MSTHRTDAAPSLHRPPRGQHGYFWLSARPLHILLFLLPVIVAAELGALGLDGSGGIGAQLAAHRMLVRFFDLFGVVGLHLPALALVVTLLVQHFLSDDRWRIEPVVPAAMVVESAFLTGPLLILVLILQPTSPVAAAVQGDPGVLSARSGVLLALGAGLYEEMLFRLVVITGMHFVAADLLRVPDAAARIIAVFASAVLFAIHHDTSLASGGTDLRLFAFYLLAGIYFGVLFLGRGLGIAVGVHAVYDLLVLVVMPGFAAPG